MRPGESELAEALTAAAEQERPDLDEREERQSPQRKAAGPGRPSRPAAAPPSTARAAVDGDADGDEEDDELLESWGRDPCAMPPSEPEPS